MDRSGSSFTQGRKGKPASARETPVTYEWLSLVREDDVPGSNRHDRWTRQIVPRH